MGALVLSGSLGLLSLCGRRTDTRLGSHCWDDGGKRQEASCKFFTPSAPSGGRSPGGRGTARDISESGSWYSHLRTSGGSVGGVVGPRSSRPSWWPLAALLQYTRRLESVLLPPGSRDNVLQLSDKTLPRRMPAPPLWTGPKWWVVLLRVASPPAKPWAAARWGPQHVQHPMARQARYHNVYFEMTEAVVDLPRVDASGVGPWVGPRPGLRNDG